MKSLLIVVIVLIVAVGGAILIERPTVEYVSAEPEVVAEPVEEVATDTITKAQQELERINLELDAKEQELLDQKSAIDAELERLQKTRASFQ